MNKKAQLFTVIAIVLLALVFVSFEVYFSIQSNRSINTRVSSMNSFLDSVEKNLDRQMYISGFRIIFLAENEITKNGVYISNVNGFFQEAFFNGTVNGQVSDVMSGATYADLISSINNKAKKVNVEISLTNSVLSVSQEDPWNVKITLTSDFAMRDKSDLARWDKIQIISSKVPISYFEDPLFIVNTNAKVSRKINQTIYEGIYTSGSDVANLLSHFNKGYYSANSNAPSFLKRLNGNLTSDANGVESFVDTSALSRQGIIVSDKSVVDYIYFSSQNPASSLVQGMPSWFKIDNTTGRFTKYNVSGLTI